MGSVAAIARVPRDLGDHAIVGCRIPAAGSVFPFCFRRQASSHCRAIVFCFGPAHATHGKRAITRGSLAARFGGKLPISSKGDFGLAHPKALLNIHLVSWLFVVSAFAVLHRASHHEGSGWNPGVIQSVGGVQPSLHRGADGGNYGGSPSYAGGCG